jgi:polyhydroxyalkanoate synthase
LLSARWLQQSMGEVQGLDAKTRKKIDFYTKQFADALSPTNFLFTNPEVLRETFKSNGENLVKGLNNMLKDLERGKGQLAIRQTDMDYFEVGRNLALTPAKIVYQNDLMQLIQYVPTTEQQYERPLVIFLPWINKYYILDLGEKNSFVKWATAKGYTVFVVSWVNPDAKLAQKTFEDYMREGIFDALDAIEKATGQREVNAIGYCIGGTLLSATLAYMAAKGDNRIKSATFFAAQADFSEAGDLQVFIDDEQLRSMEETMKAQGGYLDGAKMATTFNMLRSNDLIWSFVVNNYLMGRDPMRFDLLYWNQDSTRMPIQMHMFYLRECYRQNNLAKGKMVLAGEKLDLSKVKIPIYLQSSKEDHIAPYRSVYKSTKLFKGPITFMMAGSGHIAGVINHPDANKYQYWTNDKLPEKVEDWIAGATETPGSWWPHWDKWLAKLSGDKVEARVPGDGKLKVIEDAPGTYAKMK